MASKDNQTLQIIIIVLALGFIGMGVGLIFVNNSRKTAEARAKDSADRAQAAERSEREVQAQANTYKQYMGFSEADTYETVQEEFEKDMNNYAESFEDSSKKFRVLLQIYSEENEKLAKSESAAKQREEQVNQRLLATQKETEAQIEEFRKAADQAKQDLAGEQNKFKEQYSTISAEKSKIADQLAEKREQMDEAAAEHAKAQETLRTKIAKLERVIEILQNNQAVPDPYAQPADAVVRYANQRDGKVWLNIGQSDSLRPQVTFSVYSADTNDVNAGESKGSIEVIRILGPHMSEARITEDEATRPIIAGDKVYSQVWNRGRQVGFAITGLIDMDGDNRSDLDQLKTIIELNDGRVDAVPAKDGGIDGEMTADTRYLILGSFPDDSRKESKYLRDAWQVMNEEATTLNIEGITLNEFLSLMGWVARNRAVELGPGAKSDDFPARPYDPNKLPDTSIHKNPFRPRTPPPKY